MPIQRKNLFLTWGIRISLVPVILVLLALGLIAIVMYAICGVCGRADIFSYYKFLQSVV